MPYDEDTMLERCLWTETSPLPHFPAAQHPSSTDVVVMAGDTPAFRPLGVWHEWAPTSRFWSGIRWDGVPAAGTAVSCFPDSNRRWTSWTAVWEAPAPARCSSSHWRQSDF